MTHNATAAFYERLIERDLDAIPAAVAQFREGQTSEDLFLAVARFAVLAYAPSSHSRHALLACLSAWDVRDRAGERFDELVAECARYAAESRRPWSEPPLLDPPPALEGARGAADLRRLVGARDARGAEAWLAARAADPSVVRDLAEVACEFPGELGHTVIVTNAVARLADVLGGKGKFAVLRLAVWEMLASDPEPTEGFGVNDEDAVLSSLIARTVVARGSIETAHAVFLFDAARQSGVLGRVRVPSAEPRAPVVGGSPLPPLPVYPLARDYGACLKAHAIASRLHHPGMTAFVEALELNRREGESFAEWTMA